MIGGTIDQDRVDIRCCVVGGGTAGMILSYLLARTGVAEAM